MIMSGVPRLDQRVSAPVDAAQHRPVLADVVPQGREVLLVVVAAHHDQHVPALDLRADVRYAHAVKQQGPLTPEVLHRVDGEGLQLRRQAGARLGHQLEDALGVVDLAGADDAGARVDGAVLDADDVALVESGEDLGSHMVDQWDPGSGDDLRAEVRVAAGDRLRHVDHRSDPAAHQRLSADPVDVDVVDDRDVTGLEPFGQILGALVEPDGPHHAGFGGRFGLTHGRQSHRDSYCHATVTAQFTRHAPGVTLESHRPFDRGQLEHLPGVRVRRLGVLDAGQHPGQLLHTRVAVEQRHAARGHETVVGLDHPVV